MNPHLKRALKMAFIAGALWQEEHTHMANDGDGHVDRIDPTNDEIERAAEMHSNQQWRE